MWQDIVILAGSIVAIASLFPTLLDEEASVPLSTSVPTLVVLSGQGVAFYSLGLSGSALGAGAGFVVWSLIAYYKAPDESDSVFQSALDALSLLDSSPITDPTPASDSTSAADSTHAAESSERQAGFTSHAD